MAQQEQDWSIPQGPSRGLLPPPQALLSPATTNVISISTAVSFPECCVRQLDAFGDWLLRWAHFPSSLSDRAWHGWTSLPSAVCRHLGPRSREGGEPGGSEITGGGFTSTAGPHYVSSGR